MSAHRSQGSPNKLLRRIYSAGLVRAWVQVLLASFIMGGAHRLEHSVRDVVSKEDGEHDNKLGDDENCEEHHVLKHRSRCEHTCVLCCGAV